MRSMPPLAQLTSFMTLFMAWVMFEEWVIDRHGLDRYLPFYRVGNLCLYDFGMVLMLGTLWFLLPRGRPN